MRRLFSPRPLISLALLIAIGLAVFAGRDLNPADLEALIAALGIWAPLVFVLIFAVATVLFLPGSLFGLIGGVLFGPVWGTVWNLAGATLGCALAFLAARYLISDWVQQKASGRAAEVIKGIESEGWRFVVFVRLVPLFPFNLLNYLLGLTKLRFRDYVLTSAICMVPGTAAFAYLGYAGRDAVLGGEAAIRNGLIGLGLLVAVAYLPRLVKMFRGRKSWIEPKTLLEGMAQGDEFSLIDVRSPQEFNGPLGHIPGSRNIPLDQLPEQLPGLQGKASDKLIIVCTTDRRSAKAATLLSQNGLPMPYILRGGMTSWQGPKSYSGETCAELRM
ncbi:MAG: VTT domain-containing protein [Paracoccaceae bacterium]